MKKNEKISKFHKQSKSKLKRFGDFPPVGDYYGDVSSGTPLDGDYSFPG